MYSINIPVFFSKVPNMSQKDVVVSLSVIVFIGVVLFLVPEEEDCFGCVSVVVWYYNLLGLLLTYYKDIFGWSIS